jgi:L-ascorbate metabolism protein UlaG (beta-lactamase superfamily)
MIRIIYVGHGTVQIETAGTRILTDPVLHDRLLHLRRIAPSPTLDEIDHPDVVLISHAHFDHLDKRSLARLRPCPAIAPRGCARLLRRAGFRDVTEALPGRPVRAGGLEVNPVAVAHDGRRHPFSRARGTLGYVIDGAMRTFFAGDTDVFEEMSGLAGPLDLALLPIWGWGPRVGRGHMDPARAARAAALLEPRVSIPIHWGTLASPRAPWVGDPERPAREFAEEVAAQAPGVEVRVLPPGGRTEIAAAGGSEPD